MRTHLAEDPSHIATILLCSVCVSLLTGCGVESFTDTGAHSLSVQGTAFGGQPPVTGSSVILYATGASGYGSTATALGSATSTATGNFTISSATSCSDPEQVYIVASGGNPGLTAGTNNNALTLVAALGNCSSVSASTHVIINEVTTIAAAYALGGFTSGSNIGTSATNATGLQHAFQNAANIVDVSTGLARSTTSAGNGTVPAALINSLADILEPCVNSTSRASTVCTTLFTNAQPPSVTGVAAPTNTWQAALDMAQYPGNNTAALYGLILATPSFQPTLGSTVPNDLSIGVLYTAGLTTDGTTPASNPWGIAADAGDDIWITGMSKAGLVELSSTGAVLSPNGGWGSSALQIAPTYQVAADLKGNILTVDNASSGNVYIYNPTTAVTTVITPGVLPLAGVAVDANNNLWYATESGSSGNTFGQLAYNLGPNTFATTPTTFTGNSTTTGAGVYALTVDATTGNVWGPSQSSGTANYFLAPYTATVPASATTGDTTNYAAAVDKSGNTWITGSGSGVNGSHLFMAAHGNPSGTPISYSAAVTAGSGTVCGPLHGCGLYNSRSVMIDGNNRLFISSYAAGMIVEFDPSIGTTGGHTGSFLLTSEGNGFNPSSSTAGTGFISANAARTIAIDAAGALWTINGSSTAPAPVVQVLGIAAPTESILAKAKYGVRP